MRRVTRADEVADAIQAARREAPAAFGDGTLYVERLVEQPRHVEVQVFGDAHGDVVHLFERECSVQRRHQKVIEESPSPGDRAGPARAMPAAAVQAARAAGYRNAGTIEFLVEGRGDDARFYFLEMNTRLQVEHPVTEAVAGVDLVRAQLVVAAGEPLPWSQASLTQRGHAIEARVYAEDPGDGFLPQAGRLLLYREPRMPGVRVDAGVAEGGEVSVHYDPMLAKVIAHAETRELARSRGCSPRSARIRSSASGRTSRSCCASWSTRASARARSTRRSSTPRARRSPRRGGGAADEAAPAAAAAHDAAARGAGGRGAGGRDPWQQLREWRRRLMDRRSGRTRHADSAQPAVSRRCRTRR